MQIPLYGLGSSDVFGSTTVAIALNTGTAVTGATVVKAVNLVTGPILVSGATELTLGFRASGAGGTVTVDMFLDPAGTLPQSGGGGSKVFVANTLLVHNISALPPAQSARLTIVNDGPANAVLTNVVLLARS